MLIWLPLGAQIQEWLAQAAGVHGPTSGKEQPQAAKKSQHFLPLSPPRMHLERNVLEGQVPSCTEQSTLYLHFGQKQNLAISIYCDYWENWSFDQFSKKSLVLK